MPTSDKELQPSRRRHQRRDAEVSHVPAQRVPPGTAGDGRPSFEHCAEIADTYNLSPRERDVLQGIVECLPNDEIAARLGIEVGTVKSYRRTICDKCRVPRGCKLIQWVNARATEAKREYLTCVIQNMGLHPSQIKRASMPADAHSTDAEGRGSKLADQLPRNEKLPQPHVPLPPSVSPGSDGDGLFSDEEWAGIAEKQGLSPRRVQIARCVVAGQADKQIARFLGISVNTVRTHLRCLYKELKVESRVGLLKRLAVHRDRRPSSLASGSS